MVRGGETKGGLGSVEGCEGGDVGVVWCGETKGGGGGGDVEGWEGGGVEGCVKEWEGGG